MTKQYIVVGHSRDNGEVQSPAFGPYSDKPDADEAAENKTEGDDDGITYEVIELQKP